MRSKPSMRASASVPSSSHIMIIARDSCPSPHLMWQRWFSTLLTTGSPRLSVCQKGVSSSDRLMIQKEGEGVYYWADGSIGDLP